MVKKILVLIGTVFFLNTGVYAQKIIVNFDVSYGILGKVGIANAVLTKNKQSYTIDMELASTGLAKVLSGGRKEHHLSKGHMEKGLMVSDVYKVTKTHGSTVVSKEYKVDHRRKRVLKTYRKYKKGKLVSEENTTLGYYTKNDLLTLYFNLNTSIKEKRKEQTYVFKAVGAERQQGKVTVIIPDNNALKQYKKDLGADSAWYATAIIHQKIFSSKEGRLMLGIAEDGITNKAVLKDVIFFGDITAVRVK
ncbi:MAG TPA: DUF3108 domain-containing protein [Sulfurovum sp.]|nr:DUF3108 domain-containing protein [Sulfurovum sp.]